MSNNKSSIEENVKRLHIAYANQEAVIYQGEELKDLISLLEELIMYREADEIESDCSEAEPSINVEVEAMFSDDFRSVEITVREIKYGEDRTDLVFKQLLFKRRIKRGFFESQIDFVERIGEHKDYLSREGKTLIEVRDAKVTKWHR